MLLLFPYFLCCPPSPPCRAALHAGACWPWRPTRYCQPSFHAPFYGLTIFLWKGAPLHERWTPSYLFTSASPCSTAFSWFHSLFPRQSRSWMSQRPVRILGIGPIDWRQFIALSVCIYFFIGRKRWSTCSVWIISLSYSLDARKFLFCESRD